MSTWGPTEVAAGGDDGYRTLGLGFNNDFTSMNVGRFTSTYSYNLFCRYSGVAVANGVTVSAASITFINVQPRSGTTCNANIYLNDVDSSTAPTSAASYDGLALTSGTAWNSIPAWPTAGASHTTADFSSEVQSVVDRAGWSSGNAMTVLAHNSGTDDNALRTPATYEHATYNPPELTITYSAGTAPVTDTQSLAWDVRTAVTSTKSLAWDVLFSVPDTQSADWHVKASITDTQTCDWNVAAPVTSVSDTQSCDWNTFAPVTDSHDSDWHVAGSVTTTHDSDWDVLTPVSVPLADAYLALDGTDDFLTESAAYFPTGDFDLRFKFSTDWGTGPFLYMFGDWQSSTDFNLYGEYNPSFGRVQIYARVGGSSLSFWSNDIGWGDGVVGWLRFTRESSTGDWKFYKKGPDDATWVSVGTGSDTSGNLAGEPNLFFVGAIGGGYLDQLFPGNVFEFEVYNGYDGAGSSVIHLDISDWTSGNTITTDGLTWTMAEGFTGIPVTEGNMWDVLASVSVTADVAWDVEGSLTSVTDTQDIEWVVKAGVTDTQDIAWNVAGSVTDTQDVAWHVGDEVTDTQDVEWRALTAAVSAQDIGWVVLTAVTDTLTCDWHVEGTLTSVTDTLTTDWNVKAEVTTTTTSDWDALTAVTATQDMDWDTLEVVVDVWTDAYFTCDGASDYFTETAADIPAGDIDIQAKCSMDWATHAAGEQYLMGNYLNSDNYDTNMVVTVVGGEYLMQVLHYTTSATPVTDTYNLEDLGDGTDIWLRYTRRASDGAYKFYTSTDGISWTPRSSGTTVAGSTTGSESGAHWGNLGPGYTAEPWDGDLYELKVYNGYDGAGSLVIHFDASDYVSGSTLTTDGLTWTIVGSPAHTAGSPGGYPEVDADWRTLAPLTDTQDTDWHVEGTLTSVTDTQTVDWHVKAEVTDTADTDWDILTPVTDTADADWDVLTSAADTSTSDWHTLAAVTSTTTSDWNVAGFVTDTATVDWHVLSEVTDTLTSDFDVLTPTSTTADSDWHVLAEVSDTATVDWHVEGTLTSVSGTATVDWHTRAEVSDAATVDWDILAPVTDTQDTDWHTLTSATTTATSDWHVEVELGTVVDTTTIDWHVKAEVTDAQTIDWDILAPVTDISTSDWHTLASLIDTASSDWNVVGFVTDTLTSDWDTLAPVTTTHDVDWDTLTPVSTSAVIDWDTLAPTSTSASSEWHVSGFVTDTSTSTWHTLAPTTATTTSNWDTLTSTSPTATIVWNVAPPVYPVSDSQSFYWHVASLLDITTVSDTRTYATTERTYRGDARTYRLPSSRTYRHPT